MNTVLTPSVLAAEQRYYGRTCSSEESAPETNELRDQEIAMIESRDSFYLATVLENGWPYLQHRGGPRGFLKVLDRRTVGFADYRGNRQLISVGSLARDERTSLFLMDYPTRSRLKVLGRTRVIDAKESPDLAGRLTPPGGHGAPPERYFLIDILSYDWNCPKFITPRFSEEEIAGIVGPLEERIRELETQLREVEAR